MKSKFLMLAIAAMMMSGANAQIGPNTGLDFTLENAQQFAVGWHETDTPGVFTNGHGLRVDVSLYDKVCNFGELGGPNLKYIEFSAPEYGAFFDLSFSTVQEDVKIVFKDGDLRYSVRCGDLYQLIANSMDVESIVRLVESDIQSFR